MTQLTDTQLIVLSAAAGREDGSILPLPKTIRGGAVTKVINALTAKGLVERIVDDRPAIDDVLRITREGLIAINADPAPSTRRSPKKAATAPDTPKEPRKKHEGTKQALLVGMLRRPEGATIDQIVEATGWQRHTARGAISGAVKKKLGLNVVSEKTEGGERVYRIAT